MTNYKAIKSSPKTSPEILTTKKLTKSFGGFNAVDSVDIAVRRGDIHALIGPNGAGKTTFFNLLTKFISPSDGYIFYNGYNITRLKPSYVARRGMVRSFQISSIFPAMSVLENVRVALQRRQGDSFNFWRGENSLRELRHEALEVLELVCLEAFAESTAATLSYGRKRALELATTLALDPRLMLLDEPMSGLGQEDIETIAQMIRRVATDRTVLMVEHNLSVVATLSDRITALARGRVLAEGDYQTVAANPEVIKAYIGAGHESE